MRDAYLLHQCLFPLLWKNRQNAAKWLYYVLAIVRGTICDGAGMNFRMVGPG